jgi:hypothetical protein
MTRGFLSHTHNPITINNKKSIKSEVSKFFSKQTLFYEHDDRWRQRYNCRQSLLPAELVGLLPATGTCQGHTMKTSLYREKRFGRNNTEFYMNLATMLSPLHWQGLLFETRERAVKIDFELKMLMQETFYYIHPNESYSLF